MWHQKYIVKQAMLHVAMDKDAASLFELPGMFAKGLGQLGSGIKAVGGAGMQLGKDLAGEASSAVKGAVGAAGKTAVPTGQTNILEKLRAEAAARAAARAAKGVNFPPGPPAPPLA